MEKKNNTKKSTKKPLCYISSLSGSVETHSTWEECQKRVLGKKHARYQKVFSEKEKEETIARFEREA